MAQTIWGAIKEIGVVKTVAGLMAAAGTTIFAWVQDNLLGWPFILVASVVWASWMVGFYHLRKSKALAVPSFDTADVEKFGEELARFGGAANAKLVQLRAFGVEFDRTATVHVSHDPAALLLFLSQIGHMLKEGA